MINMIITSFWWSSSVRRSITVQPALVEFVDAGGLLKQICSDMYRLIVQFDEYGEIVRFG